MGYMGESEASSDRKVLRESRGKANEHNEDKTITSGCRASRQHPTSW